MLPRSAIEATAVDPWASASSKRLIHGLGVDLIIDGSEGLAPSSRSALSDACAGNASLFQSVCGA